MHCSQSRGVTVAQVILVHFVEVRILTGLPFFCPNSGQKNMKPEKALLHGTLCRFMQRKLRFIFCGCTAKCFIKTRLFR